MLFYCLNNLVYMYTYRRNPNGVKQCHSLYPLIWEYYVLWDISFDYQAQALVDQTQCRGWGDVDARKVRVRLVT